MTTASTLRRFDSVAPSGHGIAISALHPAYRSGRSIFPSRVFDASEVKRVLKTGHQERATCPRSCVAWGFCYGNGMQAAERIVGGDELHAALWQELADLDADHPGGFLVRLHILGDFYSEAYVQLWREALAAFPALHVFGFTARDPHDGGIGEELFDLAMAQWDRFAIRFSGLGGGLWASRIGEDDPEAVTCPAQTGGTDCCATCMLCVHSQRSIAFRRH